MKKIVLAALILLSLGACLPSGFGINPTASVDIAGTAQANMQTAVVQTLTAQPTFTALPSATPAESLFATATSSDTESPTTSSTAGITETALTPTFNIETSTSQPATLPAGSASLTPTLGVLTYGTLPPAVPFSQITLINRAKRQAYISLQVVTEQGGPTIIEYPVRGQVKIKAPIGHYLYVAWIGGREMVGEFRLHKDQQLTILLYKDRVEIK